MAFFAQQCPPPYPNFPSRKSPATTTEIRRNVFDATHRVPPVSIEGDCNVHHHQRMQSIENSAQAQQNVCISIPDRKHTVSQRRGDMGVIKSTRASSSPNPNAQQFVRIKTPIANLHIVACHLRAIPPKKMHHPDKRQERVSQTQAKKTARDANKDS